MKNLKLMMMTLMMSLVTVFMISCNQNTSIKTEIEIDESDNIRQKQIEDSLKVVKQKQIKDSLKLVELETFKNSIEFVKYYTSKPNTAGGVDCNIIWKNLSEKTVKYAKFTVVPYNEVNDRVKSEHDYSGNGEKVVKVTGPVKSKQVNGNGTYWDCLWYNWSISYMLITAIEIEYVDGTKISTSDVSIIEQLGYTRKPNN
jgi:predicted lipoprotein